MRVEQKTIGKLLQGQTQFIIPVFQRGYVWERASVQRLWADLLEVSRDSSGQHFLGAFVLAPTPYASGFEKRFVVDGQQRLTTLSILFCALRDHVLPANPDLARKIDELYLLNPHEEGEDRLKLVPLAPDDRTAWFAVVRRAPTAGGENKIGAAYRVFKRELARLDDDEPIDVPLIERAIAYQCDVVEVSVEANDNVHRIFESLNYGGEPLLQADLLRNYVFMRLPNHWREAYDQHWDPMQRLLTPDQLEDLVRINLVLRGHTRVEKETVYQTQQILMRSLAGEAAVAAWVGELHRQAQVYKRILVPAQEKDHQIRTALQRLANWGSKAGNPAALATLAHYDEGKLNAAEAAQALRVIESYLVRRSLAGIPTRDNSRNLATLVRDLDGQVPTPAAVIEHLSRPAGEFPTDDQVREAIRETNFYDRANAGTVSRTFILRYLEADHIHREQVKVDLPGLTIEHILPQRMSSGWRSMLEADVTGDETVDDVHGALVHKLGNLTLTAYNQELGNEVWASKRAILADSGLAMNRDLATHAQWGRKEILARSAALVDRIVRVWPGPAPVTAPKPRRGSATDRKWRRLPQILAVIPAGRWTSFADIAQVIGDHPSTVGSRITDGSFANAHRVLKLRQPVPAQAQRPRLEAEGVQFDRHGKASADQRITAEDLLTAIDSDDA